MSLPQRSIARGQRGVALLLLMVVLVLGTSWYLLSALNSSSANTDLARRTISSRVLAEAKQALLGYAAAQAATDANPGRLPCPEAAGYATNADPDDDGKAAGVCTLPAVGRLPWRTLGLGKLTDGYGEPLWYVVSPAFAYPNTGAIPTFSLNSNTAAQLTVDGTSAAAVALIIAPGPAMNVQTASGCTARVQQRNFPTTFDLRDYLECENATSPADALFVTTGASTSFNDQAVKVTHEELFNVVEPVVAKRIETEIAPVLKTVYAAGPEWSIPTNLVFPSAVTFTNPSTSTFFGTSGKNEGLLPMFRTATDPTRIVWYAGSSGNRPTVSKVSGSGNLISSDCSSSSSTTTTVSCSVRYTGTVRIQVRAWARRVARSMRQLNPAAVPLSWADSVNPALSVHASFIPSTSSDVYVYVQANLPTVTGATNITVSFPIGVLADHPLTDPNNAATGWFVKNNWHHLVYYAFAPGFLADGLHSCTNNSTCLTVDNLTPTGRQRAILILAGRVLGTQDRQNSPTEADYFEDIQNYNLDLLYVKPTISNTTNDRVIVVDSNP